MSLDPKMEAEARKWIEAVLERPVFDSFDGPDGLHNALKDGVVLCQLANRVKEGICPKPNASTRPFQQRENIAAYLRACEALGVPMHDLFQTTDLFEGKNIKAVLINVHALGRFAQTLGDKFGGPSLGARLASPSVSGSKSTSRGLSRISTASKSTPWPVQQAHSSILSLLAATMVAAQKEARVKKSAADRAQATAELKAEVAAEAERLYQEAMRTHNEKEALDKKLEKAEAEAAATEAAAQAETAAREAAEAEEAAAKAVAAHDAEARKEARRSFSEESHVPREVEEEAVPEGTEAIPAAISAPDKERFATPPAGFDTPTATISTATTAAVAGGDALAAGDEMAGGAAAVSRQRQAATSRSDDKLPGRAAPPPSSAVQSSMSEPAKDKEPQIPNEELLTRMVAAESKAAALEQQNRELSAAYEAATVAVTDTAASNSLPTSRPK